MHERKARQRAVFQALVVCAPLCQGVRLRRSRHGRGGSDRTAFSGLDETTAGRRLRPRQATPRPADHVRCRTGGHLRSSRDAEFYRGLFSRLGFESRRARPARGDVRAAGALSGKVLRRSQFRRRALQDRLRREWGSVRFHDGSDGGGQGFDRGDRAVRLAYLSGLEADAGGARGGTADRAVCAPAIAAHAAHCARCTAFDGRPGARAGRDDRLSQGGQDLWRTGLRIAAFRARQPAAAGGWACARPSPQGSLHR